MTTDTQPVPVAPPTGGFTRDTVPAQLSVIQAVAQGLTVISMAMPNADIIAIDNMVMAGNGQYEHTMSEPDRAMLYKLGWSPSTLYAGYWGIGI